MAIHIFNSVQPFSVVVTASMELFGVGALAHRGLPPFTGGLCGDHSPHRTTMTQTKRCPIFKFGSWWCFSRQSPQESDCEINASRRCGVPATSCCGTGPCLDQSSDGIQSTVLFAYAFRRLDSVEPPQLDWRIFAVLGFRRSRVARLVTEVASWHRRKWHGVRDRKEPTSFRGNATWVSWGSLKPSCPSGLQRKRAKTKRSKFFVAPTHPPQLALWVTKRSRCQEALPDNGLPFYPGIPSVRHFFPVLRPSRRVMVVPGGKLAKAMQAVCLRQPSLAKLSSSNTLLSLSSLLRVSSLPPCPLGRRLSQLRLGFAWYYSFTPYMRLRVLVLFEVFYWLALTFAKAPGPTGDRGGWPWRALRWCAPRWPGCTSFCQVPVQFAVLELPATTVGEWRRRHSLRRHKAGPGPQLSTWVSFKPEWAFNVIAHVRDWEHAETVRRRCLRTV